jgi:hypothetical protein
MEIKRKDKRLQQYNLNDVYLSTPDIHKVPKSTCMLIWKELSVFILEKILYEGNKFYLHRKLSYIYIKRRPVSLFNPDINWKATKDLNQKDKEGRLVKVYYTEGYKYRFSWFKMKINKELSVKEHEFKVVRNIKKKFKEFICNASFIETKYKFEDTTTKYIKYLTRLR